MASGAQDRAITLEIRHEDGRVSAKGYAWLQSAEFDGSNGITLNFSGETIKITGRNLNAEPRPNVRLFAGVLRHRVPWIQEADGPTAHEAAKNAIVIDEVKVKSTDRSVGRFYFRRAVIRWRPISPTRRRQSGRSGCLPAGIRRELVMLSKFAKTLLVGTSLAPTLIIMATDNFTTKGVSAFGVSLLVIAFSLLVIALCVMAYAKKKGERQTLSIEKAKNSDKEVLTFLLAYLLPVLTEHKLLFKDFNVPTLAILLLIAIAVYHSNAFDFNPMLGMLGYHFYEVEGADKFPYLLISRKPLLKPCGGVRVIQLCDYTFLAVENAK